MKSTLARIRNFFYQSQEFTLWLPGLVLLSVITWVVIGGMVRVGPDALAWLVELPVWCAWAAAWLGTAWLIQYLYMHDLSREDEERLHADAEQDLAGARWVLVKARLETFGALVISLIFWWPAR